MLLRLQQCQPSLQLGNIVGPVLIVQIARGNEGSTSKRGQLLLRFGNLNLKSWVGDALEFRGEGLPFLAQLPNEAGQATRGVLNPLEAVGVDVGHVLDRNPNGIGLVSLFFQGAHMLIDLYRQKAVLIIELA